MPFLATALALLVTGFDSAHAAEPEDASYPGLPLRYGASTRPGLPMVLPSAVPDPLGLELALTSLDVPVAQVRVLSARLDGDQRDLVYTDLTDGRARPLRARARKQLCSTSTPDLPWIEGQELKVYSISPEEVERARSTPAVALVSGVPKIGAVVGLSPGDRVDVRGTRRAGVLIRETVIVERASGSLRVERSAARDRVCFEPAPGEH
jgi:hypothetical protein